LEFVMSAVSFSSLFVRVPLALLLCVQGKVPLFNRYEGLFCGAACRVDSRGSFPLWGWVNPSQHHGEILTVKQMWLSLFKSV
jgi:hypothetical protein